MGRKTFTLGKLAGLLKAEVRGDPELSLVGVSTLDEAGPEELTFLANPKYAPLLSQTRAGAVVVDPANALPGMNLIVTEKPYHAFAMAVALFNPPTHPGEGVSHRAFVQPGAKVAPGATVMAGACVEEGAEVGEGAVLYPGVYLGRNAKVGKDTVVYPNVTIREGCIVGERVILQPNSVIGSDGFGFAMETAGHLKFPQVGIVVIEDDVELGACTTVDRAALGRTVVGRGTKVDNLVQIAHNVVIGRNCVLVSQSGISGSSRLGNGVVVAGQTGVAGHIKIGDRAMIGGRSGVSNNVEPGEKLQGYPLMPITQWMRAQATFKKLPEMRKEIQELKKQLAELNEKLVKEKSK